MKKENLFSFVFSSIIKYRLAAGFSLLPHCEVHVKQNSKSYILSSLPCNVDSSIPS